VFLLHFQKHNAWWALEHNYSSFYYTPENDVVSRIARVAPHEFLHIITPLNIHSDIIETFNFEKPIASRHLWLYEGVTDWEADMARLRSNLISEPEYIGEMIKSSLDILDAYDHNVSLIDASLGCYGKFKNEMWKAYQQGELTALILDLRLLELSRGEVGFRDVLVKLLKEYGKHRSFPDSSLFDIIGGFTYPEVRTFLKECVGGTKPLPIRESLAKIGYDYYPQLPSGRFRGKIDNWSVRRIISADGVTSLVQDIDTTDPLNGLLKPERGDTLLEFVYHDKALNPLKVTQTVRDSIKAGEEFTWVVSRNGKKVSLTARATREESIEYHVIVPKQALSEDQQALRRWWLSNRK
jgi:hypothetical protein